VSLEEAARRSLGRVFGQVSGSPNTLVIITAFRGENTLAINRGRNARLSGDLRGYGWGFTPVLGGFVETTPARLPVVTHGAGEVSENGVPATTLPSLSMPQLGFAFPEIDMTAFGGISANLANPHRELVACRRSPACDSQGAASGGSAGRRSIPAPGSRTPPPRRS
jgi:hypothetical protein